MQNQVQNIYWRWNQVPSQYGLEQFRDAAVSLMAVHPKAPVKKLEFTDLKTEIGFRTEIVRETILRPAEPHLGGVLVFPGYLPGEVSESGEVKDGVNVVQVNDTRYAEIVLVLLHKAEEVLGVHLGVQFAPYAREPKEVTD